jgi:glycosyltransferase involved in cell wall biosynthesis
MSAGRPKVIVVMPAYNAARTIEQTWREVIAHPEVDLIIVVDDASQDETLAKARTLDRVVTHAHPVNRGYGANQKTCYQLAIDQGADVVVMVHPDYQYTPKLIPAMVAMVGSGLYECVIASRISGGQALAGGMPMWRYVANRALTLVGNFLLGTKVSEFHTGYRAFSRNLLQRLPLSANSDDFVFDNEVLAENRLAGLSDRRGLVSHAVRRRCVVNQLPPERAVRFRVPGDGDDLSAGKDGAGPVPPVPARNESRLDDSDSAVESLSMSIVGTSIVIVGEVRATDDLTVDGRIQGRSRARTVC